MPSIVTREGKASRHKGHERDNRQRIQKQLDYLSPAAFERRYYEQRLAA
jgi:hypothetical protein